MAAQATPKSPTIPLSARNTRAASASPVEGHVRVLNPIAAGQELMRTSLLPGIHANIVENAKHFDEFRIFEIGHEIHKRRENP